MIKTILPCEKEFTVVVTKILNFLESLGSKCDEYDIEKTRYEEIFCYPEIKHLRFILSKKLFSYFIKELGKAVNLSAEQMTDELMVVSDNGDEHKL